METTIFLAKAWGLLITIASFSLLANPKGFKKVMHYMKNEGSVFIAGYVSLILGIITVLLHNIWEGGLAATIITVFGWLALAKGSLRILLPGLVKRIIGYFEKRRGFMKLMLFAGLIFGIYLLIVGF